jgi:hypothetical protein
VSIQPWYHCLSLKVVGVDKLVFGSLLQGLGQGDSAGRVCLDDEQRECILLNAEALRGDVAGAFTIYAAHTCYLWEGMEIKKGTWEAVGSVIFVSQSAAGWVCLVAHCCRLGGGLINMTCLFHSSQWRVCRLHFKIDFPLYMFPYRGFTLGGMPIGVLQSLLGQAVQIFVCGVRLNHYHSKAQDSAQRLSVLQEYNWLLQLIILLYNTSQSNLK